jgi:RNA polymerase sigma-70 factor (TIGR02960 family)
MNSSFFWADPPEPARRNEVVWLEPYPDVLLGEIAGSGPGPEARYAASEAISLAFIIALQLLPPRQRAVLILRDVLGFRASEVAQILETSTESVTSALKRARATLNRRLPPGDEEPPPAPDSAAERALVQRLTRAFAAGDPDSVVALLTEDVRLSMPPLSQEYQGRDVAAQALSAFFGRGRACQLVATRANGQPAFGIYVPDPHAGVLHATGLIVITLTGSKISAITCFDTGVLARFGLPRTLPTG